MMSKIRKTKSNDINQDSKDEHSLSRAEIDLKHYLLERQAVMICSLDKEHQELVSNLYHTQLNSPAPYLFRRPGFRMGIERAKKVKLPELVSL